MLRKLPFMGICVILAALISAVCAQPAGAPAGGGPPLPTTSPATQPGAGWNCPSLSIAARWSFPSLAIATVPATQESEIPRPGAGWETASGWSKPVNNLKVNIDSSSSLTRYLGMQVSIMFWNTGPDALAVPWNPNLFDWKVKDAAGKLIHHGVIKDALPSSETEWHVFSPNVNRSGAGMLFSLEPDSRDGHLRLRNREWKLGPGVYTLECTIETIGNSPQKPPPNGAMAWQGRIEATPVRFTVYAEVTEKELKVWASVVGKNLLGKNQFPDAHARWIALAELINPGMTTSQLELVLPPSPKDGLGIFFWNGNNWTRRYMVDAENRVTASGIGVSEDGHALSVLTGTPKIELVSPKGK